MTIRSGALALIIAITCLSAPKGGYAAELEIDYQQRLCVGLLINRHLKHGTEVDCISDTHAIEVDFTENGQKPLASRCSMPASFSACRG